jgi:phosphoserine phosphatase
MYGKNSGFARLYSSADINHVGINTVIFDVDGTLVNGASWPMLFGKVGARKEHKELLGKFQRGEYKSYTDWSTDACEVLIKKGLTRRDFYKMINSAPLVNGAEYVCKTLKLRGYKTGIITGGFEALAQRLRGKLDMDFYAAACCDMKFGKDGKFQDWAISPCDYEGKAEALKELSKKHDFKPKYCAYVGDGEGDVAVMKSVGLPIAFNPKSENVRKAAKHVVEGDDIKSLLGHFPEIRIE